MGISVNWMILSICTLIISSDGHARNRKISDLTFQKKTGRLNKFMLETDFIQFHTSSYHYHCT